MKVLIKQIAIGVSLMILSGVQSVKLRGLPMTPKAMDLNDHFGLEPAASPYGPQQTGTVKLMREGITGEGTPITPITNFNKEINPAQVVSGDLDNTSYDASKIVKPELASKSNKYKLTLNNLNYINSSSLFSS